MNIAVVFKQDNGLLERYNEEISNDYIDIINRLEGMKDNTNRTVLDMQACFGEAFHSKECFRICLPYSFSATLFSEHQYICYPHFLTYDDYTKKLNEYKKELDELKKTTIAYNNLQIENKLEEFKKELKNNFFRDCKRYIDGHNYTYAHKKISNKPETIMLSSEKIGWTSYEYEANDDVQISIKTNFGYGNSSYFLLSMKYKNVDILPFSTIIHYYYANIIELRRYTRQYNTDRESWNIAFDFVVESANMAKNSPSEFIKKFIFNEINEMLTGLKSIANNPSTEIKRFLGKYNNKITNGFCYSVRNIRGEESKEYLVYQNEMDIAFKAEKITGALLLLDKLSEFVEIFPTIQNAIDEIKSLNHKLIPELLEKISHISNLVKKHNDQVLKIDEVLTPIEEEIKIHKKVIEELLQTCKSNDEMLEIKNNPNYKILIEKREELLERSRRLKKQIFKRERFIEELNKCYKLIQTYILAA
jgi:hypothetical protein